MKQGRFSLFIMIMLLVSLHGVAQHLPSTWSKVCSDVNNHYHSAAYDKKRAVAFLLENAPYHLTKVNDTLSSYIKRKTLTPIHNETNKT